MIMQRHLFYLISVKAKEQRGAPNQLEESHLRFHGNQCMQTVMFLLIPPKCCVEDYSTILTFLFF